MKNLFIVMGVSGSGKSTMAKQLNTLVKNYDVYEFDDLGVPTDFTTIKQWIDWRVERTDVLMSKMTKDSVICGTVLPYEFIRFNDYKDRFNVKFCHLTLDAVSIRQRLSARGWDRELIEDNVRLDKLLAWDMVREYDGLTVKTDEANIIDSALMIDEWIQ